MEQVEFQMDFLLPVLGYIRNFHLDGNVRLATKFFMAILCPFLCEQEILKQKFLLLIGQKETTPAHG